MYMYMICKSLHNSTHGCHACDFNKDHLSIYLSIYSHKGTNAVQTTQRKELMPLCHKDTAIVPFWF